MIGFLIGLPIGILTGVLLTLIFIQWYFKRALKKVNGDLQDMLCGMRDPYDHLDTAIKRTEESINRAEKIMGGDRH